MKKIAFVLAVALCVGVLSGCGAAENDQNAVRTITDGAGRQVEVPEKVED